MHSHDYLNLPREEDLDLIQMPAQRPGGASQSLPCSLKSWGHGAKLDHVSWGAKVLNKGKCFTWNIVFLLSTSQVLILFPPQTVATEGVQCGGLTPPRLCRELVPKEGPTMDFCLSPGVSPSADEDGRMPSSPVWGTGQGLHNTEAPLRAFVGWDRPPEGWCYRLCPRKKNQYRPPKGIKAWCALVAMASKVELLFHPVEKWKSPPTHEQLWGWLCWRQGSESLRTRLGEHVRPLPPWRACGGC